MANNDSLIPQLQQIKDQATVNVLRQMWDILKATQKSSLGPETGLLINIPRNLAAIDAGRIYHATDYDRLYRWTGTAWADFGGQVTRLTVAYFPVNTTPTGWAICNGGPVQISTSDGRTASLTPPTIVNVNNLFAWIRL